MKLPFRTAVFGLVVLALALLGGPGPTSAFPPKKEPPGPPEIKGAITIKGFLSRHDPRDRIRPGPYQAYTYRMKAGKSYQIDLVSLNNSWDNYLRLEDDKGNQLAADDDSGGFPNARIIFQCPADGTYHIIATVFSGLGGQYTLTIK
jgi:hypothetical protein